MPKTMGLSMNGGISPIGTVANRMNLQRLRTRGYLTIGQVIDSTNARRDEGTQIEKKPHTTFGYYVVRGFAPKDKYNKRSRSMDTE